MSTTNSKKFRTIRANIKKSFRTIRADIKESFRTIRADIKESLVMDYNEKDSNEAMNNYDNVDVIENDTKATIKSYSFYGSYASPYLF
jgi:hypothetical protein